MLLLSAISKGIKAIGIWLASGMYHVAARAFELFLVLASGQLLEADTYKLLVKNFYVVLGVIVLFFLAFLLLKSMINPEEEKGSSATKKVIINLVTSSIILVLLPTIFTFLFDFQKSVIVDQNTIGRFFGYGADNNPTNIKEGAFQIVNGVYTAFFNVDPDTCPISNSDALSNCQDKIYDNDNSVTLKEAIEDVEKDGKFSKHYSKFTKAVDDGQIDFNFLMCLIAGVVLAYVAISFCIDMAVRLVKLVFYQLIAPIPLFSRVIPDTKLSDTFNQWLKVTFTCYMEVYVRVFAIYFAIFLSNAMLESNFIKNQVYGYGSAFLAFFTKAFVVMGIVIFMRQLPKLLSEVTGLDSGNMKLGIRDKLKDAGVFTAGAAVGGAVTAGFRNATNAFYGKDKWKNKEGKVTVGSVLKTGITGLRSTIAGTGSGFVRGGRAGMSAGSAADMRNAAGSGAKGAIDARDRREAYRARHGDAFFSIPKGDDGKRRLFTVGEDGKKHLNVTGTAFGHIEDAFDTGKRWAGINNIEEYQESIASMDNVNSKVDAVADEARKVLASNAKTGKKFDYGLYQLDESGRILEVEITDPTDPTKTKKVKVLRQDKDVAKQYGVNLNYSLDNYRSLENAIQRAESSGGSVFVRNVNGRLEVVDPDAKNVDGTAKYTEEERKSFKSFDVDTLSRMQNLYVTNYSEAVANQAFKSKEHYEQITDNMEDYKEVAAMSAIRAKAEDAKQEMARVLNSEAVARANKASYEHYYKKLVKDYMEEKYNDDGSLARAAMTQAEAEEQAKKDLEARKELFLTADTVEGDLRITDRTALNYYGAAVKEVKSEYQTEISKIQQKEKDKNGK